MVFLRNLKKQIDFLGMFYFGFKSINNLWYKYTSLALYFVGNKAKGRISQRVFQETKHAKFSEKRRFVPGGKKC